MKEGTYGLVPETKNDAMVLAKANILEKLCATNDSFYRPIALALVDLVEAEYLRLKKTYLED